jgi:hypothetical protein
MQIEDLKRWHWALVGLVAGLVFAFTWQDHDVVGNKTYEMAEIKQVMFEKDALSKSRDSEQPILQNVKVEPPVRDYMNRPVQIVIGQRLRFNQKDQKDYLVPFYYYAAIPYKPRIDVPGAAPLKPDATVQDYLLEAKGVNKALSFRYAWEYESHWFTALWAIGGVVVVGGIWPSVLQILLGAGLGRPPKSAAEKENEDYLSRFGKGPRDPKPVLAAKGPTEADKDRLDEMNTALESQLAAAGVFATAGAPAASQTSDDTPAAPAIVALNAGPTEPSVAAEAAHHQETEEERRKRFAAGDFYPVARGTKKV